MVSSVTLLRKRVVPSLTRSHQRQAPQKIPNTKRDASKYFSETLTRPKAAKIARKEIAVSGFERVRRKVETKSEMRER